jgi:UDP-galactopyranose mutase
LQAADAMLAQMSWDRTQADMAARHWKEAHREDPDLQPPTMIRPSRHYDDVDRRRGAFCRSVMADGWRPTRARRCCVIDRRPHIAATRSTIWTMPASSYTSTGRNSSHQFGGDLLYLSRFTDWRPYEHRVLGQVEGSWSIPINAPR